MSKGRSFATAAVLGFQLIIPIHANAQSAWVPFKGEGNLSLTFQALDYPGHFAEDGTRLDGAASSRGYLGIFELEYGWTDRLATLVRLPYIASRFTGSHEHPIMVFIHERYEELKATHPELPSELSLDTGDFYSTFQDFLFTVRYNVYDRGLTVTPVVGLTVPSHHYKTVGEAAPGQDRIALHTGVNVGRLLDPILPHAYVHARYTYSFVQKIANIPLDRSSADFEVGYGINSRISVRALGNWLFTHGGIGFLEAAENLLLFLSHDRLLAAHYWHLGGGTTIALNDTMDLDAAVISAISGADTHYGVGMSLGLTWRFLTPRAHPSRLFGSVTAPASQSTGRRLRSEKSTRKDPRGPRRPI